MKKAMLSQPMAGKTDEEIIATREQAIKILEAKGYEIVNTLFTDEWYSNEKMKEEGKTIYKARNEIKVFEVDGVELNVKRYRVPLLINRVIYRFFRQPKAVRAYEYALRLVAKGFETPAVAEN